MVQTLRQFNLKKRFHSPRDFSFHKSHLGAATIPDSFLFLSPILDQGGENSCTAYASVAGRANEIPNGNVDPQVFYNDELAFAGETTSDGFDLEVPAAVAIKTGFSPLGNPTVRGDKASAYFWITPNNGMDWFDSCRSAMNLQQRPTTGGLLWFNEWTGAQGGVISSMGQSVAGGHCVKIAGFTILNGVQYAVIQNSWGGSVGLNGLYYMTREVFNASFPSFGVFMRNDSQDVTIKTLGLISALYINLKTLLHL